MFQQLTRYKEMLNVLNRHYCGDAKLTAAGLFLFLNLIGYQPCGSWDRLHPVLWVFMLA